MKKKSVMTLVLLSICLLPLTACGKKSTSSSKSKMSESTSSKVKTTSKSAEKARSLESNTVSENAEALSGDNQQDSELASGVEASQAAGVAEASEDQVNATSQSQGQVANTSVAASSQEEQAATPSTINVNQMAQNNFSTLVGTWTNPTTGQSITITGKMIDRPEGSAGADNGVEIAGLDMYGNPRVIYAIRSADGIFYGASGSYGTADAPGSFGPIAIIPSGVKANMQGVPDDSDSSRDRIIMGGGQAGFAPEAYYR